MDKSLNIIEKHYADPLSLALDALGQELIDSVTYQSRDTWDDKGRAKIVRHVLKHMTQDLATQIYKFELKLGLEIY